MLLLRCVTLFICLLLVCISTISANELNVRDFGAVGDGVTDDTAAFQKALDKAGEVHGSVVFAPVGNYLIKTHLNIPPYVTLKGVWEAPQAFVQNKGTTLLAVEGAGDPDGTPFITMNYHTTLMGITIYYPDQKPTQEKPTPYPWTIANTLGDNISVLDCLIVNPYQMIRFVWAGRHYIRGVYGQPLYRGIYIDECYDVGRIENCHLWPFFTGWLDQHKSMNEWMLDNAIAFEFARTDWQYVLNTFCFGYAVGYKFSESRHGSANGNFLGIGADCTVRPILVEQAQPAGLLITNAELVGAWGRQNSVCVEIGENVRGKVSITNSSFWGPIDRCVWMKSPHTNFTSTANHFINWNNSGSDRAAIEIDAGRAIINGNTFGDGDTHVKIGPRVQSAIIMGNQARGGISVQNQAGSRTVLAANEENPVHWTGDARLRYRIEIGIEGDSQYLRNWHDMENSQGFSARWSTPTSRLILPVEPGRQYYISMDMRLENYAKGKGTGLFIGDKLIASLDEMDSVHGTLRAVIPAQKTDTVELVFRTTGWVPNQIDPASRDYRVLGAYVQNVRMTAFGSGNAPVFDANTGEWLKE